MKIAYFDCFAGAAGDMILGALLDAGLSPAVLKEQISRLGLSHYDIQMKEVRKKGIRGTQALVTVEQEHHCHHHRHLSRILDIIRSSALPESVKEKSSAIFRRLAEAEAKVHGIALEEVHFHEVGAADAIIDVVGSVIGLNVMGIEQIVCSPLHLGSGTVECAHGILPVPPPAVAELVRGLPVYSRGIEGELLTPTAAAIFTSLASAFGPVPSMRIQHIGYGAGRSDPAIPNFLRVMIGNTEEAGNEEDDQVAVMECNMDDMNPQIYDYLMQKILEMGARDVFLTPVQMKKNRPGTMLTVISLPEQVGLFADFLLRETTSIGLRWRMEKRIKAQRRIETLETGFGTVRIKIAERAGTVVHISPEYEDCRKLAAEKNISLKTVMGAAASQAMHRFCKSGRPV